MNILEIIGNTPLIDLTRTFCSKGEVCILGKFEGANPAGSVKDRPAHYMIKTAEEQGLLTPDKTILEPTSGSTGIALAMIGAAKGYKVTLVMPECVSMERRLTLEAYGATLILTPGKEGTDGAIRKAREMVANDPEKYYMPDQFSNPANIKAHYETTGPEILRQTEGDIDIFVASLGTTGTLMGAGKYLREHVPGIKIVAVEPAKGHTIQGLKNMEESMVPSIYDPDFADMKVTVGDDDAFQMTRMLATHEGILVGMSSGAAIFGAVTVGRELGKGTIVTVLPDRGERYLSTNLFRSICAKCPP